ncbi:hypothetical protein P7K49_009212, partial [Saguinus oedipus]
TSVSAGFQAASVDTPVELVSSTTKVEAKFHKELWLLPPCLRFCHLASGTGLSR